MDGVRLGAFRKTRAYLRLAVFAVLATSTLVGVLRANTTYFFCEAMQEERSAPCCHRAASEDVQVDADCECCHLHVSPALPASKPDNFGQLPRVAARPLAVVTGYDIAVSHSPRSGLHSWPVPGGIPPPTQRTGRIVLRI